VLVYLKVFEGFILIQIDGGLNQIVTVEIEYEDGTHERVAMTKRQAIELQDKVTSGKKPGIKRVSW
jgi:hypothetical protein